MAYWYFIRNLFYASDSLISGMHGSACDVYFQLDWNKPNANL